MLAWQNQRELASSVLTDKTDLFGLKLPTFWMWLDIHNKSSKHKLNNLIWLAFLQKLHNIPSKRTHILYVHDRYIVPVCGNLEGSLMVSLWHLFFFSYELDVVPYFHTSHVFPYISNFRSTFWNSNGQHNYKQRERSLKWMYFMQFETPVQLFVSSRLDLEIDHMQSMFLWIESVDWHHHHI